MNVQEIDPSKLKIDPLNERNENIGPHKDDESLEESIQEQGLIQPPIVRSDGQSYKVIVGQRRTLAAQTVGLDKIPVIIVDWDDSEALQASITENVDAFQKEVSRSDRASAVQRLMEINNWTSVEIAEELGVTSRTVQYWTERTRDEWEQTSVHVDAEGENKKETEAEVETHSSNSIKLNKEKAEQVNDRDLATIRTATDSAEEREEVVQTVAEENLSGPEIREAKKLAERSGDSVTETVQEVVEKKKEEPSGGMKASLQMTFTGDYAVGLRQAAKEDETSEEQVVRDAIADYLTDEGYL